MENTDIVYLYMKIGIIILCVLGIALGIYIYQGNTVTEYKYTVKSEQVETLESNETVTEYDELSPDMKNALHSAFKKQDHFFGSASAEITTDERLDISTEWKIVNVDGAVFIISVQGPDKYTYSNTFGVSISIFILVLLFITALTSMTLIDDTT